MTPSSGRDTAAGGVVWLCLPWQAVSRGNLGLALLSSLVSGTVPSRSLFANVWFARQIGQRTFESLQSTRFTAEALFTPAAFDLEGERLDDWMRRAMPVMIDESQLDAAQVERSIVTEIPQFIDSIVAEVVRLRPSVVGISLLVNQVVPAIAVGRALKKALPNLTIVTGGSASFGSMGAALLSSFDAFDVAVTGEVGRSIARLIPALIARDSVADLPAIAYRDPAARTRVLRNAPNELDRLDDLPPPDYDDYVEQFRASGLEGELWLPFESSRGCWWGEYSTCTFCGLNAENVSYRRKSPVKVGRELRHLHDRYGVTRFCATDNILPKDAAKELLPALAEVRAHVPDLRIYYQMKSSLSRDLLAAMVGAGVTLVQPGIESFHDNTLRLMRKGANAVSQIRALKLITEAGIEAIYGILHGTVGETAEDLRQQTELIPALSHLVPPSYVTPISLDRFSPYTEAPADYGIELLAPARSELLFPDDGVDRLGIAGAFDYRHTTPRDPRIAQSAAELEEAVQRWRATHRKDLCTHAVLPGPIVHVWDRRDGDERHLRLDGVRARIFLGSDLIAALPDLARRERIDRDAAEAAADWLDRRHLIVRRRQRTVSLPTRRRGGAIIGLTGWPCVGKSTLLRTAEALGLPYLDVGAAIRERFGDEAYNMSPADKVEMLGKSVSVFRVLGPELREAYRDGNLLLIDSFKAAADLDIVREEVPSAMVESLLIIADRDLRARRFAERARSDDPLTLAEKEEKLTTIGITEAIRAASWTIPNDGDRESFQDRSERFLRSVLAALNWADR